MNKEELESQKKEDHIRQGLRAIWRHLRPFKSRLFVFAALGILSAIANGFAPYLTGRFFDATIAKPGWSCCLPHLKSIRGAW